MDIKTIKSELWEIAKVYPTVRGLIQKQIGDKETVGHVWAVTLSQAGLDADHFENVCYEFASLERQLPEPQDQLPFLIRQEVRDRMYRDRTRMEQHMKYHQPRKKMPWREDNPQGRWCRIVQMVLAQSVSDDRVDELVAWEKGGAKPEWLDE